MYIFFNFMNIVFSGRIIFTESKNELSWDAIHFYDTRITI